MAIYGEIVRCSYFIILSSVIPGGIQHTCTIKMYRGGVGLQNAIKMYSVISKSCNFVSLSHFISSLWGLSGIVNTSFT